MIFISSNTPFAYEQNDSWFAYISESEPCLLEDVLISPKHSLCQQVHEHYLPKLLPHGHDDDSENDMKARNMLFNIDGLGVAWYTSSNADYELGNTGQSSDGTQKEVWFKTPPVSLEIFTQQRTRAFDRHSTKQYSRP